MKLSDPRVFLIPILLLLVACSSIGNAAESRQTADVSGSLSTAPEIHASSVQERTPPTSDLSDQIGSGGDLSQDKLTAEPALTPIIIPISVYIITSDDETLASGREPGELTGIFQLVNDIWTPAQISLEVQQISKISLPDPITRAITAGDFQPFFDGAGKEFDVPDPSTINAFYARAIGGPNGIVPYNSRLFFVMDEPSVHHERVTSHEIGHILGLHHTRVNADRLMFSGTNGLVLTDEETTVARYTAQGILDRVR